jgi:hypothetical protein
MQPTHFAVLERRFLLAGLLFAAPFVAVAQEKTPRAFIEGIYRPYLTKGFKGQPYWKPAPFFAPDLAAAIERDAAQAKQRKEVPVLDGDPFVDAQDWEISDLLIATSDGDGKAQAAVTFKNLGEPKALALLLIRTPQGWRIADIVSANGSLRALYKLR